MTYAFLKAKRNVRFLSPLTRLLIGMTLSCLFSYGCSATPTAKTREIVASNPIDQTGLRGREPMIVEHPGGTLFVSGYGEPSPTLWKSLDRGASWTAVDVGNESDGAIGNSDVDLAVANDGTLYFATMVFDRKTGQGTSISIGVSKDQAETWTWTLLSKTRFDDRPWVEVAADGKAHVIWNDGEGVCHAVSDDGGRSWNERPKLNTLGGSSHLALGPNGEVAARVTPLSASGNKYDEGVDLVVVSGDSGLTWQKHAAPGQREWSAMLDNTASPPRWLEPVYERWVEPLAWDSQGALYSLWGNREGLWLARSVTRGETWTTWRVVETSDVMYFPYLVARGRGELAATWFSGAGETLRAHAAFIEISDSDAQPRISELPAFEIDSWTSGARPEDTLKRDSAGEYLAITFLKDGGLAMVSPIQNARDKRYGFSIRKIEIR